MNKLLKILPALLLLLSACSNSPSTVNLSYTNRIDLPEMPRPLTLLEVEWTVNNLESTISMLQQLGVITDAEAIQFKNRLVNNPNTRSFAQFSLDGKNYEKMKLNQAELKRFLEQQRIVIEYFIQATEPTRNRINTAPSAQ
jgi:hypothetical protein